MRIKETLKRCRNSANYTTDLLGTDARVFSRHKIVVYTYCHFRFGCKIYFAKRYCTLPLKYVLRLDVDAYNVVVNEKSGYFIDNINYRPIPEV